MRYFYFMFFIGGLFVNAQDNIGDIKYTSTPAATIIGLQNKELNTINSYETLYTELITPIVSTNNNLPTNINLEFAPYFLKSRDITANELSKLSNIWKRAKISISATKVDIDSENSFSRSGIGLRFNVIRPQYQPLNALNDLLTIITLLELTNEISDDDLFNNGQLDFHVLFKDINDEQVKQKVITVYNSIRTNTTADRKTLKEKLIEIEGEFEAAKSEYGFSMDIAGSFALDFPENTISYSRISRWGAWMNVSYKENVLAFATIGRFSNYSFNPDIILDNTLFIDIGVNLTINIDKLKLSAEYIGKTAMNDAKLMDTGITFDKVTEHKWDAALSYQITDKYLISLSYSEAKGNSDYFKEKMNQLLIGVSAAIFSFKK